MESTVKIVAAVQGGSSTQVQGLFRDLVARLQLGTRIAGVIEEDHGLGKRACSAGRLQSIVDGRSYPIFQDLGPDSDACHLDGSGAISASEAVCADIAAGCDLVLLSKFGKLESSGRGLAPAFAAAVEAGVPVLTAVVAIVSGGVDPLRRTVVRRIAGGSGSDRELVAQRARKPRGDFDGRFRGDRRGALRRRAQNFI